MYNSILEEISFHYSANQNGKARPSEILVHVIP